MRPAETGCADQGKEIDQRAESAIQFTAQRARFIKEMAYSPAFQFYPGEYLADKNTIPMKTVEHGAYCLLIWVAWEQDGLPDDMNELADIARLPVEEFVPMWERRIKKCFVWDEKKKLFFHPRSLKEIKKQKAWKKKKSEDGKKGAESRWGTKSSGDGSAIATHATPLPPNASSSSSPISFPISSFDLKRLIDWAVAENSKKDARLVEVAILETLMNRNGSTEPINSLQYFAPQIKQITSKGNGIPATTIDALLKRRREQMDESMKLRIVA